MIISGPPGQKPKSPLTRILAAIISLIVLGLALTFSLVFFAILIVVGVIMWLYFWWKTRQLRKIIRENSQAANMENSYSSESSEGSDGLIIEGDAIRLPDEAEE